MWKAAFQATRFWDGTSTRKRLLLRKKRKALFLCALQAFIERADAALYEDKRKRRAARGQVEVARREAK